MTPEQRAAFNAAAESIDDSPPGMSITEWIFICGLHYQHVLTLERAAKVAETLVIGNYDLRRLATGPEAADAIRALPFEDKP